MIEELLEATKQFKELVTKTAAASKREWDEIQSQAEQAHDHVKSVLAMNAMLALLRNPMTGTAQGTNLRTSLAAVVNMFAEKAVLCYP